MLEVIREIEALKARVRELEMTEYPVSTGTWTPVLVGSGTAGSFTYTGTGAEYTRIGDRVLISGRVNITATSVAPTGNLTITGLPFTPAASASVVAGGVTFIAWSNINVAAGYTDVSGSILNGTAAINLIRSGDAVASAIVQGGELAAAIDLQFFGEYRIA